MKPYLMLGAAGLALVLAGCGTNEKDRVQGGAAAGAATGAGIGAFGGPPGVVVGGLVGGGAGAITGATTSPSNVNLGKPVWNNPEVRTPVDGKTANTRRSTNRRTADRTRQNNDGAYMGGGMVVQPGGTPANPSGMAPAPGTAGPAANPQPNTPTPN